jgi:hypothetical protein
LATLSPFIPHPHNLIRQRSNTFLVETTYNIPILLGIIIQQFKLNVGNTLFRFLFVS